MIFNFPQISMGFRPNLPIPNPIIAILGLFSIDNWFLKVTIEIPNSNLEL